MKLFLDTNIYQSYDAEWKNFEETNGDVITPDEACLKLQNFE